MQKMKVLHLISGFGGGIAAFVKNKAKSIIDSNVVFDVMTFNKPPDDFLDTIKKTGGNVYVVPNPKVNGFKSYYSEVSEVYSRQPKDVFIHSHIQGYRVLPFFLIAKKYKLNNFGIHAHQSNSTILNNTFKIRSEAFINRSVSTQYLSCGKLASAFTFGDKIVEERKVMHVPNSIDPDVFLNEIDINQKKTEVLGQDNHNKFIIGHVGRFHEQKNHKFMIEIIEKLKKRYPDFLWLFIGTGELKEKIEKDIVKKGLEEQVLFLGHRTDVEELYKIMDVLVLPSHFEGLPTVAIEAQASGLNSLLADTITTEADLNMGLIDYLPIDDAHDWVDYLLSFEKNNVPSNIRLKTLNDKKFSNKKSAELYVKFLNKKITHYEI